MISHGYKCIFLHPNKCGGKSVEKAVFGVEPVAGSADHRKPDFFVKEYGPEVWNTYFKFGFTRNPFDRMVSIYNGRIQLLNENLPPFEKWLTKLINNHNKRQIDSHLQYDWFYYKDKPIDFIGKFENYENDFKKAVFHFNSNLELPHLNASKRKDYKDYYNDNTKRLVAKHFEKDLDVFKYKF